MNEVSGSVVLFLLLERVKIQRKKMEYATPNRRPLLLYLLIVVTPLSTLFDTNMQLYTHRMCGQLQPRGFEILTRLRVSRDQKGLNFLQQETRVSSHLGQ